MMTLCHPSRNYRLDANSLMDAISAAYPTLETTLPCNYDEDHTDPMTSIIRTDLHLTDRRLPPTHLSVLVTTLDLFNEVNRHCSV